MLERSQSLAQYYKQHCKFAGFVSTNHGSHTPLQEDGTSVESTRRRRRRKANRNRQLSQLVVNIETGAKQCETMGTVEELSTSLPKMDFDGRRRKKKEAEWQVSNVQRVNIGDCLKEPKTAR